MKRKRSNKGALHVLFLEFFYKMCINIPICILAESVQAFLCLQWQFLITEYSKIWLQSSLDRDRCVSSNPYLLYCQCKWLITDWEFGQDGDVSFSWHGSKIMYFYMYLPNASERTMWFWNIGYSCILLCKHYRHVVCTPGQIGDSGWSTHWSLSVKW